MFKKISSYQLRQMQKNQACQYKQETVFLTFFGGSGLAQDKRYETNHFGSPRYLLQLFAIR